MNDTFAVVGEEHGPALSLQHPTELREKRKKVVGASEVAALFGLHPRMTAFELALYKTDQLPEPDLSGDEYVEGGIIMEPSIARWVEHRTGWMLTKAMEHVTHPRCAGWGVTPDYMRVNEEHLNTGSLPFVGPVEIKRVSAFQTEGWKIYDEDVGLEAPLHIELQLQAQLGALQMGWGAIGADVAGKLRIIQREVDPVAQEEIGTAIVNFWETIRRGDLPEPEPERDAAVIRKLYGKPTEGSYLLADNAIYARALALEEARERASEAKVACETAQAELLLLIKDAETVKLGDGRQLTARLQKRAGYTVDATEFRTIRFTKARP